MGRWTSTGSIAPASRGPRPVGGEQQQKARRRVLPPPGGTPRCRGCRQCSVAWCHPGKARSRAGARGSRCKQAPSAALVTQAQLTPCPHRSTRAAPGSWPHLATATEAKGEELLRERDPGEREEAGKGIPWHAAPRQALQLWQGSL